MAPGRQAVIRGVGAVGHSLGGSTAAALMRAEPAVRAGVDLDGSIFGPPPRPGVSGPFLVMGGGEGLDPTLPGLLKHSRGPRPPPRGAGFLPLPFSGPP